MAGLPQIVRLKDMEEVWTAGRRTMVSSTDGDSSCFGYKLASVAPSSLCIETVHSASALLTDISGVLF